MDSISSVVLVAFSEKFGEKVAEIWFEKVPLWGKLLIAISVLLLLLLLFSLIIGIIAVLVWSVCSLFTSNAWKSLSPEVAASIIAGLFAVFTLLLSNYFTRESQIISTLRLKEIEFQEAALIKKSDFYSEVIDKLIGLTQNPLAVEDITKNFYGKLYIQGSPRVVSIFIEIVENIKSNGNNQEMLEIEIRPRIHSFIVELCREVNKDGKNLPLRS